MRFLKKLFKKEIEKKQIKLDELSSWLIANVELDLKDSFIEIKNIISDIKTDNEQLNKVKLDKHKVEKKIISKVSGNKSAYVKSVNQLITKIKTPKSLTYDNINTFIKTIDKNLNEFNKRSIKNYSITKYLVGEELEKVVDGIKKLNKIVRKIEKEIDSKDLKLIEEVHAKLKFIHKTKIMQIKQQEKIKEYDKKIQDLMQLQLKQKEKIRKLKESPDYYKLNDWLNEEDYYKEHLGAIKNMLNQKFSILERALRKRHKQTKLRLIQDYIKDSYNALIKDKNLKIADELTKIEFEIKKLGLKPSKAKKTLKTINELSVSELKITRNKIIEMDNQLKKVQNKIANNTVEKKNLKFIEELNKLVKKTTELEERKNTFQEASFVKDIIFLESALKKITGIEITIID